MTAIDYVFIGIVVVSVLIGLVRGFLREAVSLAAWVIAIWAAFAYGGEVASWLGVLEHRPELQLWVARGLVFLVVLMLGTLLNYVLSLLVRSTGLSGTDRVLGTLFGLARGVLIVGLLVLLGQFAELDDEPWWEQSLLMPQAEQLAETIRELAVEAMSDTTSLDPEDDTTGVDATLDPEDPASGTDTTIPVPPQPNP